MTGPGIAIPGLNRVLVATDRSETADKAVHWAASLAVACQAELILLQVLVPEAGDGTAGSVPEVMLREAADSLTRLAHEVVGSRGRARVVVDSDPAAAILDAVTEERVDTVIVGNLGMRGRKQFLLGNIPNRVSHNARCTVIIVNTAQLDDGTVGAVEYRIRPPFEGAGAAEDRPFGRAWHIGRVLVRAGLGELLRAAPADEDTLRARAQRLRVALDELGPTFAKLGQIMSTRPDLLPKPIIDELATLQERVTPLTEAEVVAAMERELGVPWEDVFASIDPEPLAAGTIAQVHRATLEGGERVVIKIQRPSAERDIFQDLRLLEMFTARAAGRPAFRQTFDLPAMVEHLSSSLRRELDFRQEAGNLKRMREVLAPFPNLDVPAVYEDYSTARLLVMEEVQGVLIGQAPPGPARTEAARALLECFYSQVIAEGFFHADPHPGNMKWWNDKIYLIDLGMVGELGPEVRDLLMLLVLSFAQEDPDFLAEAVLLLSGDNQRGSDVPMASFREALRRLIARYRQLSLKEIQLGPLLQEVAEIAVRHNIRIPAVLTLAGKAFAQMQQVAADLDPTLDPFDVAQSFFLRRTVKQLTGGFNAQKIFYEGQKLQLRVTRILEAVEGITGARPGGNLQVSFKGETLEATVVQLGRRVSLGLGACGALIGTALLANADRVPRWAPSVMGGLGSVLVAGLLADLRRRPS